MVRKILQEELDTYTVFYKLEMNILTKTALQVHSVPEESQVAKGLRKMVAGSHN